jgi:hypothetical protein
LTERNWTADGAEVLIEVEVIVTTLDVLIPLFEEDTTEVPDAVEVDVVVHGGSLTEFL